MTLEQLRQMADEYRSPFRHVDERVVDDFDEDGNIIEA